MRITALVKGSEHVCCRYRVAAFRAALERAGHRLDIRAWPNFWLSRLWFYHHLGRCDVLIVQRRLLPSWQLRLIRRRVRRLIFDYDDSIFLHNSYNPRGTESKRRSRRFAEMVRLADAVVAGNDYLRGQALPHAEAQRVHTIPTCVDVTRYPLAPHDAAKGNVEMVWVGSSSTIQGLERSSGILDGLGKSIAGLQLKVICDRSLALEHLPVRYCPWQETTEAEEIACSDIGISWLPEDPWSAGKCGLKLLQYMAAGLPVVANPVGLQTTLVRHGETGFLASTPQEWQTAIGRLAADPALRRRLGRAGRRLVEAEYQVTVGAAAWLRLLAGLETPAASRAS